MVPALAGRLGYERAAERVREEHPETATKLRAAASDRAQLYTELQTIAATYGDQIEESGSLTGALHRGWMTVKDAFTSSDVEAVIEAAKTGEDHAIEEYQDALKTDISAEFRPVLERQLASVKAARANLSAMVGALT